MLYFKISERPAHEKKIVNMPENKFSKPVIKIDYKEWTEVCNPPKSIELGDEGNIGS